MAGLFTTGGAGASAGVSPGSAGFSVPGDVAWPGTDRLADIRTGSGTAAPQVPKSVSPRASPAPGPDIGTASRAERPAPDARLKAGAPISDVDLGVTTREDVQTGEKFVLTGEEFDKIKNQKATADDLAKIERRMIGMGELFNKGDEPVKAKPTNKAAKPQARRSNVTRDIEDFVQALMR